MSIGDLSLYQPVFSQFSVAAISVDCYLSHSSSDLNQRWRLQKIPPPPAPKHEGDGGKLASVNMLTGYSLYLLV